MNAVQSGTMHIILSAGGERAYDALHPTIVYSSYTGMNR
jgi:hypothetical protein